MDAIKILLLEDSDIDAELIAAHLSKAEIAFALTRATGRDEFVAAIKASAFDIVLADFAVPSFDGLSALALVQQIAPETPFILVSGMQGEEFATGALKRGAVDYVMKRNMSRLPSSITRALADARERNDRRRAEDAVHALNTKLEGLVESRTAERDRIWRLSRDLFAVVSNTGHFISVNPAWASVLGHTEAAMVGQDFASFAHPDDIDTTNRFLASLAQGSLTERCEMRLRRVDGEYRWISWTAVAEKAAFYTVGRDVTQEKAAAAELQDANESLKAEISERERIEATLRQLQRLEAVGQLTSGIAHDFNNLLTIILGNTQFLDRALVNPAALDVARTRRRVSYIREAADRGAKLTAQLLAFSRRQSLAPKFVNINESIGGMGDLMRSSIGGKAGLEIILSDELWTALVDPTQVEMIVLNLTINARDAMPNGGTVTIQTSNVTVDMPPRRPEEPNRGTYVCLTVKDTGTGMSEEVLAKAFEPFFTTKGPSRGSGLGLAQVFGSAKQSGGGVRVDTCVGKGTSIHVYFPKANVVEETQTLVGSNAIARPGLNRRVLVVDDDKSVREITATMIEDLGYQVAQAESGPAALALMRTRDFDVLVADYSMPEMSGVELVFLARASRPNLPAIIVTGFADMAVVKAVGENFVIQKPFNDTELAEKLEQALSPEQKLGDVIPFPTREASQ